ncbi:hypothetical protein SAY86_023259 [Trapa natans]|uniref:GATA transcription factor n=1 Tax=Trapa natans TaxID=22666 RepID=A0AAN7LWZ0_TRANT|nr:hypothetical protein SAY86_023259 [Trapa natans]
MSTEPSHVDNGNMEELDCTSYFDNIDDLLDFSMNDDYVEADLSAKLDSFPSIWSTNSDTVFPNNDSDISVQLPVPYEDIVQLEWLSKFVEDSFSGGGSLAVNCPTGPIPITNEEPFKAQFCTTSPVSVLESSSSSCSPSATNGGMIPVPGGGDGGGSRKAKARSKRPRPATFNPRPAIRIISPSASSVAENLLPSASSKALSDSENYAESRPAVATIKVTKLPSENKGSKKKKIKLAMAEQRYKVAVSGGGPSGQVARKCLHCEITKTPQWRAGPLGPKTLCNACGVRYKSGRLFPEYRPAASPTFVPSVHSNSHKKVLEMRGGKMAVATFSIADPPELIPNPTVQLDCM